MTLSPQLKFSTTQTTALFSSERMRDAEHTMHRVNPYADGQTAAAARCTTVLASVGAEHEVTLSCIANRV